MSMRACAQCAFFAGNEPCTAFPNWHAPNGNAPACRHFTPADEDAPTVPPSTYGNTTAAHREPFRTTGGKVHLSIAANRDEFRIPDTGLGDVVCRMRLGWGRINGRWQPVIMALAEAGAYRRATGYTPAPQEGGEQ